MWQVKVFKTHEAMTDFIDRNEGKIEYEIVFVNNGYAIEYRELRVINL